MATVLERVRDTEARGRALEVSRSLTFLGSAEAIYRCWSDPTTFPQVMGHFAQVTPLGHGHMRWQVRTPLGRQAEWETQVVEDRPDFVRWASVQGAPLPSEGSIRLSPALGERGTVVTMTLRFAAPGGVLAEAAARAQRSFVPKALLGRALRRFKSLFETGEIPTTSRQPAGRGSGRDE